MVILDGLENLTGIIDTAAIEEYDGSAADIVPGSIEDDLLLLSVSSIMKWRLAEWYSDVMLTGRFSSDNYFDCSDFILYDGKGTSIKTVFSYDRQGSLTSSGKKLLKIIQDKGILSEGTIDIGESYERFIGPEVTEFTRPQIIRYTAICSEHRDAISNRLWRIAARHPDEVHQDFAADRKLLPVYVKMAFDRMRRGAVYTPCMGIYLLDSPRKPCAAVLNLDRTNRQSNIYANTAIDSERSHLAYVRKENWF